MAGFAIIGLAVVAVAAAMDGGSDWGRFIWAAAVIILACAGRWGLSAIAALTYGRNRRPARGPAARHGRGPWNRLGPVGKVVPFPRLRKQARGRAFFVSLFAAGVFLTGFGAVFWTGRFQDGSDPASGITIIRGGQIVQGSGGSAPARAGGVAVSFSLCRSGWQRSCVIDGDTIRHEGRKIRLADIDTPEISQPKCASEAALGHRAKVRLLELLNHGPFEIVHPGGRDEDVYGRKLRVLLRDGRSLGSILVEEGLARRWTGARRSWCT